MKRKTCAFIALLLTFLCLLLTVSHAEGLDQNRITERLATLGPSFMDVDMPKPAAQPASMDQMKVERVRFDKKKVRSLIEKYGLHPSQGESWVCEVGSGLQADFELIFREENGVYGSITYDETSPCIPLARGDDGLEKADAAVKKFLDELGLSYEYPFYHVALLDQATSGIVGDVPLVKVVARLMIDGVPCNTTIGWTRDSDGSGNGDPTPGAFFIVTTAGEITTAVIRNPVEVVKVREDTTPLKGWREILDGDKDFIMNSFCTGDLAGSSFTLKQAEFVMMVDAHQIAYPAWAYCFSRFMPADEYSPEPYTYDMMLTYDARTSERVWMQ